MAQVDATNINHLAFWEDGKPYEGIKTTVQVDTGSVKYWEDGRPAKDLFVKGNSDTGKFFLLFEE